MVARPPRPATGCRPADPVLGDDFVSSLVLGAVGILLGASIVFWLGAQLAARLFGGSPLSASVSDAGLALLRLSNSPGNPAGAWSPAARDVLPGPVAYYFSLGVVVACLIGIVVAGFSARRRLLRPGGALGIKPHAGFGSPRDLRRLVVPAPQTGRLTLGRLDGRLVAAEPQASLAVIGPTGCGKTAGLAVPALLEWSGPVLATSVKNDLLDATLAHRARRGRVWVYDPTRSGSAVPSPWSPLASCGTWGGAMRMAAWLSQAAQPRQDTVSDGDYWYSQARKGLAPYLFAAASSGAAMRDVVRWVDTQDREEAGAVLQAAAGLKARLTEALASRKADEKREELRDSVRTEVIDAVRRVLRDAPDGRAALAERSFSAWPRSMQEQLEQRVAAEVETRVRAALEAELSAAGAPTAAFAPLLSARALWAKEPRMRSSVYATMENVVASYADPDVADAADGVSIDVAAWLEGDNTIFVVASPHEQERLRPVFTVIVQQVIRAAYDAAARHGGTLKRPCLALLDEAGNIAPLRDLPAYASTARSHGITLVTAWQDLAQIKAIYRDRAQTVLNNHRAKLFGTGIADEATLSYLSHLVGDEARIEQNHSADVGGQRRSVSEHTAYRPAAPIDMLRRIQPDRAVLLYGSELPAHIRLRPWFDEAAFDALVPADSPARIPPGAPRPDPDSERRPVLATAQRGA